MSNSIALFNSAAMVMGLFIPVYTINRNGLSVSSVLLGLVLAMIVQYIILFLWVKYEQSKESVRINDLIDNALGLILIISFMSIMSAFIGFYVFYSQSKNNILMGVLGMILLPVLWFASYMSMIKLIGATAL